MRAKLIERTGLLALLDGESYGNCEERAIAIKAAALKWKSEIRYWLGLEIKPSQTPVEICNKLLVKLGLKGEAIARPGTVGRRDRIYQVSGMANPFRDRLLEAARRRLAEASPNFDESSVVDGLEMLRDAEGDEAALEVIWQALKALPEADQREIQSRRSVAQLLLFQVYLHTKLISQIPPRSRLGVFVDPVQCPNLAYPPTKRSFVGVFSQSFKTELQNLYLERALGKSAIAIG